jgi:hypothetical protein
MPEPPPVITASFPANDSMSTIVTAARRLFNCCSSRVADDGRYGDDWALVGMIEGYSRHMGHADLLRERIDGRLAWARRPAARSGQAVPRRSAVSSRMSRIT